MIAHIELEYKGIRYRIDDKWNDMPGTSTDELKELMIFWWEQGNGACDCNRSLEIGRQCDHEFPHLLCGDDIKLISISVDE